MLRLLLALSSMITVSYADEPIRVAVIDTGLNLKDTRFHHLCSDGHKDLTNTSMDDNMGHGTHVTSIIEHYAGESNYCLIIIKLYDTNVTESYHKGIAAAIEAKADIINISGGGSNPIREERAIIEKNPSVLFVVAAGNNGTDLDKYPTYYPAAYGYRNIIAVGSRGKMGRRSFFSNYGSIVTAWENGEQVLGLVPKTGTASLSGTSQATAIRTGKMVMRWSLH